MYIQISCYATGIQLNVEMVYSISKFDIEVTNLEEVGLINLSVWGHVMFECP